MRPSGSRVRRAARLLVCVFVASLAAPAVASTHAEGIGPPSCPDTGLALTHLGEHFEGVKTPVDPDHCPLCHWLRDVSRAAPRPGISASLVLVPAATAFDTESRLPGRRHADGQPSRAPPRHSL